MASSDTTMNYFRAAVNKVFRNLRTELWLYLYDRGCPKGYLSFLELATWASPLKAVWDLGKTKPSMWVPGEVRYIPNSHYSLTLVMVPTSCQIVWHLQHLSNCEVKILGLTSAWGFWTQIPWECTNHEDTEDFKTAVQSGMEESRLQKYLILIL